MKKFYTMVIAMLLLGCANIYAAWEQIYQLPATYACHVTKSGNILVSDYQYFDYSGGIYISEDNGETWIKTNAEDFCYSEFCEIDGYIFAGGEGCHLARSADEGKTWEVMSFAYVYSDYLSEDELRYDPCYAIAYHKDRLYVGDLNGGGIAYSEDFGETWTLTDRESLMYNIADVEEVSAAKREKPTRFVESFYKMGSFNGSLYAFGVYFIFRLNEETNLWEVIRDDSNFMGVTTEYDGKLVCGRAIMNYTDQVPFLEWTIDGNTWGEVKRPEGMLDNNVRALACDSENLYVGLQQGGMFYTPDFGESWENISEGLPYDHNGTYYSLLMISVSDDYLYAAIYDTPWSGSTCSGLYRKAKSELPTNSVSKIVSDNVNVYVEADNLSIIGVECQYVDITSVDGQHRRYDVIDGKADISGLSSGVYIYSIGGNNVGKFVKR